MATTAERSYVPGVHKFYNFHKRHRTSKRKDGGGSATRIPAPSKQRNPSTTDDVPPVEKPNVPVNPAPYAPPLTSMWEADTHQEILQKPSPHERPKGDSDGSSRPTIPHPAMMKHHNDQSSLLLLRLPAPPTRTPPDEPCTSASGNVEQPSKE